MRLNRSSLNMGVEPWLLSNAKPSTGKRSGVQPPTLMRTLLGTMYYLAAYNVVQVGSHAVLGARRASFRAPQVGIDWTRMSRRSAVGIFRLLGNRQTVSTNWRTAPAICNATWLSSWSSTVNPWVAPTIHSSDTRPPSAFVISSISVRVPRASFVP